MIVTGALFVLSTAGYVEYARLSLNSPTGATPVGLGFGIASAAIVVFAALFGVRRKFPTLRVGRVETWLKAHIWLGLLSYPLAFYHAGFKFGGPLTVVIMILFSLVILSGIVGLVFQQIFPRLMTAQIQMETIYEQIDHILGQLAEEADKVVSAVAGELFPEPAPVVVPAGPDAAAGAKHEKPKRKAKVVEPLEGSSDLKAFYLEWVRPFLTGAAGKSPLEVAAERSAVFEQVRVALPPPLYPSLVKLEDICEERRQLLAQRRLHHWLVSWLFIHLPLSVALVVLTTVHAIAALRY